ncbi:MAG TPA: dienelactone hydrolase family protein [Methylomirabilota bacterium]
MDDRTPVSQEMIDLYDEYTHLTLDRRRFIERLSALVGGTAAAYAVIPLLEADKAAAQMIAPGDAGLATGTVTFPGAGAGMAGYLAWPKDAPGKLPAVIVIHENRGLNPHIQDVTRRMALEGFLALAPDFLAPAGGTPSDEDEARRMIGALDPAATLAHAVATRSWLAAHERSTGKTGVIGFCWGGGLVNRLATADPALGAAVAYYGRVPDAADVAGIKAKMLLHYAGLDQRINAGIPAYKAALEAAGVTHAIHVYDGVNHAFNNDTSAARYDKAAADLAWRRTVAFLEDALG